MVNSNGASRLLAAPQLEESLEFVPSQTAVDVGAADKADLPGLLVTGRTQQGDVFGRVESYCQVCSCFVLKIAQYPSIIKT